MLICAAGAVARDDTGVILRAQCDGAQVANSHARAGSGRDDDVADVLRCVRLLVGHDQ